MPKLVTLRAVYFPRFQRLITWTLVKGLREVVIPGNGCSGMMLATDVYSVLLVGSWDRRALSLACWYYIDCWNSLFLIS